MDQSVDRAQRPREMTVERARSTLAPTAGVPCPTVIAIESSDTTTADSEIRAARRS
jgi:hypothetical protein